jgi:Domain of unknown function (DUF4168)
MPRVLQSVGFAVLTAASLFSVPSGYVHAQSPSPGVTGRSPSTSTIPDQKLDAAATAMQRATNVQQRYQKQIAEAPPSDKQRITEEANGAIQKAITDQGLSLQEYNSIMTTAQSDPTVRNKLLQRLNPSTK